MQQLDDCGDGSLELAIGNWLTAHSTEWDWIAGLAKANEHAIPMVTIEDLWRLYALSRVSDAMITLIGKDSSRVNCYKTFMEGLGLREIIADRFHPFYHEVVKVISSATADEPIKITGVAWPGFMSGPLMIARAGVSVSGGFQHIRKDIAETSTLYWAYRRAGRPAEDRSLGWGGNSQWRTAFRRDYSAPEDNLTTMLTVTMIPVIQPWMSARG